MSCYYWLLCYYVSNAAHLVSLHPHNNPEVGTIIVIIILFFINGNIENEVFK